MIVFSHPTGNANARAVAGGLDSADMLDSLHTSLCFEADSPLMRWIPRGLSAELLRRNFPVDRARVHQHVMPELLRLFANRVGAGFLTARENDIASVDTVYRSLDRQVGQYLQQRSRQSPSGLTAVYCYEDGAFSTFSVAREIGLKCIYDLPIAYWEYARTLLNEEVQRLPVWAKTISGVQDSTGKLERKTREISMADIVVCPSKFVYDSLPETVRTDKTCIVAELGTPRVELTPSARNRAFRADAPLRVLFAGIMTQRKGLADVFSAMTLLRGMNIELVVMGTPLLPMSFYREQYSDFVYEAPRPHASVLELMQTCDVLVLPSIIEGRALVQQEAMACGLPLLVTANAGAEDLIEEGRTGFLVPIRAPEALAEKLVWFSDHRRELEDMREQSMQKAASVTWERYVDKVLRAIKSKV